MTILNIRKLPEDVHAKLRVRAARAGRSMEAEARAILAEAVEVPTSGEAAQAAPDTDELVAYLEELYGTAKPTDVVDSFLAARRREWGDV